MYRSKKRRQGPRKHPAQCERIQQWSSPPTLWKQGPQSTCTGPKNRNRCQKQIQNNSFRSNTNSSRPTQIITARSSTLFLWSQVQKKYGQVQKTCGGPKKGCQGPKKHASRVVPSIRAKLALEDCGNMQGAQQMTGYRYWGMSGQVFWSFALDDIHVSTIYSILDSIYSMCMYCIVMKLKYISVYIYIHTHTSILYTPNQPVPG